MTDLITALSPEIFLTVVACGLFLLGTFTQTISPPAGRRGWPWWPSSSCSSSSATGWRRRWQPLGVADRRRRGRPRPPPFAAVRQADRQRHRGPARPAQHADQPRRDRHHRQPDRDRHGRVLRPAAPAQPHRPDARRLGQRPDPAVPRHRAGQHPDLHHGQHQPPAADRPGGGAQVLLPGRDERRHHAVRVQLPVRRHRHHQPGRDHGPAWRPTRPSPPGVVRWPCCC